jgi:hypothetical protein
MSDFDKQLLNDQLDNYQIQRHDFLNNFQVIRGYLQLNMPEKALEYIDEELVGILPQQEIYMIGQKSLLAMLLGLFFKLRLKGVEMVMSFPPEMKKEEFWQDNWQEEYAQRFYGYTIECLSKIPLVKDPEDLLVELGLHYALGGFACEFRLLNQGELYLQNDFSTRK